MSRNATQEQTLTVLHTTQERITERFNWLFLYHTKPQLRPQLAEQLRREVDHGRTK